MNEITLWHSTKDNSPISGIKRYETELEKRLNGFVHSINRPDHPIRGETFLSYLLDYTVKGDIVHATSEYAAIPALLRDPEKLIVTSHGPIPIRYPELQKDVTTKLQWKLTGRVLKKADVIIANSHFTKRELLSVYPFLKEETIEVIHLGVSLNNFRPLSSDKRYFGLGREKDTVLILSSNLPQKRMGLAEEVVDRLKNEEVEFVKAGYGEDLNHPDIIDIGWLSNDYELVKLYNCVDLLFHPSEYESFGLPLLEAMACNTPVLAQNKTAIPEVVGRGGKLVNGNQWEICSEMLRMLETDFGMKPRTQAEKFSWEKTVEKTEELYKRLL